MNERQCVRAVNRIRAGDTRGFTLIELMVAVSIVGLLASIAVPNYIEFLEKARVARAISELHALTKEIKVFVSGTGVYPDTLAQIGRSTMLDPWGSPYRYYRINCSTGVEITNLARLKLRKKRPPRVLLADHPLRISDVWHVSFAVDHGEHQDLLHLVAGGGGAGGGGAGGGGGPPCGGVGGARKDRFLVPLNSDFDVYSMGRDRASTMPLSAALSHDDVIRASDGGYYGLGKNF
jgi:general secretion pathway protein G